MCIRHLLHLPAFLGGLLLAFSAIATTAPTVVLHPFTATYQVERNGAAIGQSTLTLSRNAYGNWCYASEVHGTHGLAALLGASIKETSIFRWHNDQPEAVSYDYALNLTVKSAHRHLVVDWSRHRVSMTEHGKTETYATTPGLVERHIVPLALALAIGRGNKTVIPLPVAVKDRVQIQQFEVMGTDQVRVPAGRFAAKKVARIDRHNGFTVWYAARHPLAPVKLAQSSGGHITLQLESYKAQ